MRHEDMRLTATEAPGPMARGFGDSRDEGRVLGRQGSSARQSGQRVSGRQASAARRSDVDSQGAGGRGANGRGPDGDDWSTTHDRGNGAEDAAGWQQQQLGLGQDRARGHRDRHSESTRHAGLVGIAQAREALAEAVRRAKLRDETRAGGKAA